MAQEIVIDDELKVVELPETNWKEASKEDIVRTILEKKEEITKTFTNDEYLKIDLTNGEIVGFKSTAKLGDMELGDLSCLNFILAHNAKYKEAHLLNLGKVNTLYEEFKE